MNSQKYTGLCIGGPGDGKYITAQSPVRVHEWPEWGGGTWGIAKWPQGGPDSVSEVSLFETYYHVPLASPEASFWVPQIEFEKGRDSVIRYVIEKLIARYAENESPA